jgi:hypothetical protein
MKGFEIPSRLRLRFFTLDNPQSLKARMSASSTIGPPSSPAEVITALSLALSPSPESRAQSLSALQAWSILPGYYSYLVKIFIERGGAIDDGVRLQALLQFKNGVDKYWRRTANQ